MSDRRDRRDRGQPDPDAGSVRYRVCFIVEGSYPYITGGVSAWVHDLIVGLPEIDFALYTISPFSDQEIRYELPDNVVEHVDVRVSETKAGHKRLPNKKGVFADIVRFHDQIRGGTAGALGNIIKALPTGYYLSEDAVSEQQAWDLIIDRNQLNNPTYINGDNNLENLCKEDDTWKVRLIEEEFGRLMFDVEDV